MAMSEPLDPDYLMFIAYAERLRAPCETCGTASVLPIIGSSPDGQIQYRHLRLVGQCLNG